MEQRRAYLAQRPVKIFRAKVYLAVFFVLRVLYFVYAAPAIGAAPAVRGYGDRRAYELVIVKMRIEQVEHVLGFLYDFGYFQHCRGLLKIMFQFCVSQLTHSRVESKL